MGRGRESARRDRNNAGDRDVARPPGVLPLLFRLGSLLFFLSDLLSPSLFGSRRSTHAAVAHVALGTSLVLRSAAAGQENGTTAEHGWVGRCDKATAPCACAFPRALRPNSLSLLSTPPIPVSPRADPRAALPFFFFAAFGADAQAELVLPVVQSKPLDAEALQVARRVQQRDQERDQTGQRDADAAHADVVPENRAQTAAGDVVVARHRKGLTTRVECRPNCHSERTTATAGARDKLAKAENSQRPSARLRARVPGRARAAALWPAGGRVAPDLVAPGAPRSSRTRLRRFASFRAATRLSSPSTRCGALGPWRRLDTARASCSEGIA